MRRLKNKMIMLSIISSIIVFSLTMVGVYVSISVYYVRYADSVAKIIAVNNGVFPQMDDYKKFDPEDKQFLLDIDDDSAYRARYFVVYLDEEDTPTRADTNHISKININNAKELAITVLETASDSGFIDDYRYKLEYNNFGDKMIVFIDCSESYFALDILMLIMLTISVAFTGLIALIFAAFSKRILRPFEENSKRQKQFITDASHELKTPLAIISANAEVLKYKYEENDWTNNITHQIEYMSKLINELLILTKMEEASGEVLMEPVNFSELAESVSSRFDEVFISKGVTIEKNICPNIIHNANMSQVERLISILTENASKYVSENGRVVFTLTSNYRQTVFSVFNTADIEKNFDVKRLFDRFYRLDSSRTSSTGGHGIGLSIAKKITSIHNGKISAAVNDEGICFKAEFSNFIRKSKPNENGEI